MKKIYLILGVVWIAAMQLFAQTDPGTTNLKHQWTFDDGTALDKIGNVTGTVVGNGTLANKGFNTSGNAHMTFPAGEIGINAFPEITTEIWCTSDAGKNSGWTMLSYFGATEAGGGKNCTFVSIARAVDGSMVALETGGFWDGATGAEYDDGKLHHFVSTISANAVKFYIDGVMVAIDSIQVGNSIANISTQYAYLGRGGWSADPNWLGTFHKYSLYNKALTDDNILFLYQAGAEKEAVISANANAFAFDTNYPAEMFNVTSANLSGDVVITAPAGITVEPAVVTKNQNDVPVAVIWDGTTVVNGNVQLKSGSTVVDIPVKTTDDSQCYQPLYENIVNLVENSGLNSISYFSGWGTRNLITIINDPAKVFCGASTIEVGDGLGVGTGSLNYDLNEKLLPNTKYRLRAMIKTMDGSFQIGVLGWSTGQSDLNFQIDTKAEWMALDTTFTTGAAVGDDFGNSLMFFNNWACTGRLAYIDNWEMYALPDPLVTASLSEVALDPEFKSMNIIFSGSNLAEDITLSAPAGITLSKTKLLMNEEYKVPSDTIILTWDGVTSVADFIIAASSGNVVKVPVKSTNNSNLTCFEPLYSDNSNLVPDPFMNNPMMFGGWGAKKFVSIISDPDSVFCGSHTGLVDGNGSMDVILTGIIQKDKSYIARVKVRTIGGAFQLGVWGVDALSNADVQDSIDTQGTWNYVQLAFATADSLSAGGQGMFVNNFKRSGKKCFIDNWELYEIGGSGIFNPTENTFKTYLHHQSVVAEFNMKTVGKVTAEIYNLQGMKLASESFEGNLGRNVQVLQTKLNSGLYIIQINADGNQMMSKIVK